jgi:hypothetical protein
MILEPKFDHISSFDNGFAIITVGSKADEDGNATGGKNGIINQSGKIIVTPKYDKIEDFIEGLAKVEINGGKGLIDKTGKLIVEPKYDDLQQVEKGVIAVSIDEKVGYIDNLGATIWAPTK